jgi:hydrogenase maturation protease
MAGGSRKLILIAAGNPLRRDDGVAQRALQLLPADLECETRSVLQWTPELAAEIAGYETVVFLDADTHADAVAIQALSAAAGNSPLTHAANAAEIVALSTALYGFTGRALLCRIPASDFSEGEGLSERAELEASQAVATMLLYAQCQSS